MKAIIAKPRQRKIGWILLVLLLLPIFAFSIWYWRQLRQQRLDHALIEAIKRNDTPRAIAMLNEGADANARDVEIERRELWQKILDRWIGKGSASPVGASPLITGLEEGYENPIIIKALLERGAD